MIVKVGALRVVASDFGYFVIACSKPVTTISRHSGKVFTVLRSCGILQIRESGLYIRFEKFHKTYVHNLNSLSWIS